MRKGGKLLAISNKEPACYREEYKEFVRSHPFLEDLAEEIRGQLYDGFRAIDLGCAVRANSCRLLQEFSVPKMSLCVGVDLQYIEPIVLSFGVERVKADFSDYDIPFADESFDLVMLTDVIEHLHDPFRTFKEARRILKPNGLFYLTTPNHANLKNRVKLLLGQSAYPALEEFLVTCRFRAGNKNVYDGHIREYTAGEIKSMLHAVDLKLGFLKLYPTMRPACHITGWELLPGSCPDRGKIESESGIESLSQNWILFKLYNLAEKLVPAWRYTMVALAKKG